MRHHILAAVFAGAMLLAGNASATVTGGNQFAPPPDIVGGQVPCPVSGGSIRRGHFNLVVPASASGHASTKCNYL